MIGLWPRVAQCSSYCSKPPVLPLAFSRIPGIDKDIIKLLGISRLWRIGRGAWATIGFCSAARNIPGSSGLSIWTKRKWTKSFLKTSRVSARSSKRCAVTSSKVFARSRSSPSESSTNSVINRSNGLYSFSACNRLFVLWLVDQQRSCPRTDHVLSWRDRFSAVDCWYVSTFGWLNWQIRVNVKTVNRQNYCLVQVMRKDWKSNLERFWQVCDKQDDIWQHLERDPITCYEK